MTNEELQNYPQLMAYLERWGYRLPTAEDIQPGKALRYIGLAVLDMSKSPGQQGELIQIHEVTVGSVPEIEYYNPIYRELLAMKVHDVLENRGNDIYIVRVPTQPEVGIARAKLSWFGRLVTVPIKAWLKREK